MPAKEIVSVDHNDLMTTLELDELTFALLVGRVTQGLSYQELADKFNVSRHVVRSRLLKRSSVEATKNLMQQQMIVESTDALKTLRHLMTHSRSDKVKLDAALGILDRAGFSTGSGHSSLSVTGNDVKVEITI